MSNRKRPLEPHHRAWLSAHPERDETWLRERLADGFHVHHIDENPFNNAPWNLALVEGRDHRRLHTILRRMPDHRPVIEPAGDAPLCSSARTVLWREKNRGHYNETMKVYMRSWRADRRAEMFTAAGQLALFTGISDTGA